jgi:hypothetical protein
LVEALVEVVVNMVMRLVVAVLEDIGHLLQKDLVDHHHQ